MATRLRLNGKAKEITALVERRLTHLSHDISRFSGYSAIEQLKNQVVQCEEDVLQARENASRAKLSYSHAVETRALSQRETNDLLSRKNSWTSSDVSRFTELIKHDHDNEQAERDAKQDLDRAESQVDNSFTLLMKAILARYHEEQVWSDKVRSMSTYGTLAITGVNVCIFLLSLLFIEPYRRHKMVEGIEHRMLEQQNTMMQKADESLAKISDQLVAALPRRPNQDISPNPAGSVPDSQTEWGNGQTDTAGTEAGDGSSTIPVAPNPENVLGLNVLTQVICGLGGFSAGIAIAVLGNLARR